MTNIDDPEIHKFVGSIVAAVPRTPALSDLMVITLHEPPHRHRAPLAGMVFVAACALVAGVFVWTRPKAPVSRQSATSTTVTQSTGVVPTSATTQVMVPTTLTPIVSGGDHHPNPAPIQYALPTNLPAGWRVASMTETETIGMENRVGIEAQAFHRTSPAADILMLIRDYSVYPKTATDGGLGSPPAVVSEAVSVRGWPGTWVAKPPTIGGYLTWETETGKFDVSSDNATRDDILAFVNAMESRLPGNIPHQVIDIPSAGYDSGAANGFVAVKDYLIAEPSVAKPKLRQVSMAVESNSGVVATIDIYELFPARLDGSVPRPFGEPIVDLGQGMARRIPQDDTGTPLDGIDWYVVPGTQISILMRGATSVKAVDIARNLKLVSADEWYSVQGKLKGFERDLQPLIVSSFGLYDVAVYRQPTGRIGQDVCVTHNSATACTTIPEAFADAPIDASVLLDGQWIWVGVSVTADSAWAFAPTTKGSSSNRELLTLSSLPAGVLTVFISVIPDSVNTVWVEIVPNTPKYPMPQSLERTRPVR